MQNQTLETQPKKNTTLWILLASFLIPMFLAYGYFFWGERPNVSSNGTLINPVIDIEELKISDNAGQLLDRESLTHKWRLYYFVNESCNENCQQTIFNMRQINKALGKNKSRLEYVIVHLQDPQEDFSSYLQAEHTDSVQVFSKELQQLDISRERIDISNNGEIYLMDPIGNIMMSFSKELNPKLILKDINKLLKISRIG